MFKVYTSFVQDTSMGEKVVSFEWLHCIPLYFLIITDLINLFGLYNLQ